MLLPQLDHSHDEWPINVKYVGVVLGPVSKLANCGLVRQEFICGRDAEISVYESPT